MTEAMLALLLLGTGRLSAGTLDALARDAFAFWDGGFRDNTTGKTEAPTLPSLPASPPQCTLPYIHLQTTGPPCVRLLCIIAHTRARADANAHTHRRLLRPNEFRHHCRRKPAVPPWDGKVRTVIVGYILTEASHATLGWESTC